MKTILIGLGERMPRPTPAMGVALLALLIACSGTAVAAIPSTDGTITACRDTKTGVLRVIDTAAMQQGCATKETRISWKDGITGKVADSDKLDNKDSADFYAAGSKVADSAHADRADNATSAGDADTLDGKDSTEFLGKTEKAADADTLDGLDSTELEAASAIKVGRLELPVPPPGGQTNTGTVFETAAFEIQGQCMNSPSFPLPNVPTGRLLLVAKQRTLAITYSPEQSTTPSEVALTSGESVEFAEAHVTTGGSYTYGSYVADAFTSSAFLQGQGTLSIMSAPSGSGQLCRFSATGLGQ